MIECYYSDCKHHSIHEKQDDGPLCFESHCKATLKEIVVFSKNRKQYLNTLKNKTNEGQ